MKRMLAAFGRGGALIALTFGALVATGTAQAAGTVAGTVISNSATLDYSVGNVPQGQIGSSKLGNTTGAGTPTTFVVDNKVNVQVDSKDLAPVTAAPGQTDVTTTFTVSNTGNSTQDFALSAKTNLSGTVLGAADNFDLAGACSYQVDATSGTGAGPWAASSTVSAVAPDKVVWVRMMCPMPAGRADGDAAVVALVGEARALGGAALVESTTDDPDVVDIVFADIAGSDDNARDARHSARAVYKINASRLTITKTVTTICDPINGSGPGFNTSSSNPIAIPGAYMRYTVSIANAGAAGASALLSKITDQLETTKVSFDNDLIRATGNPVNCKAGTTTLSGAAGGAPSGQSFRITAPANRVLAAPGTYPKFVTGDTTDSDGTGIDATGKITVDFAKALPAEGSGANTYAAGELKPGEQVILMYQVQIK